MNSIVYAVIMIILWVLNLFNGTGLGSVYQTTERARLLIYMLFFVMIMLHKRSVGNLKVEKKMLMLIGAMSLFFIGDSYMKGYGYMGLHYISAFMLVYILSKMRVTERAVKLTGLAYIIMGMGVLYIFDYGSILSGWNGNSIGMIALYSYLIFMISLYDVRDIKSKIIIIMITVVYIYWIEPTDSRSCTWFAIIAVLFALSILPRKFIVASDKRYYWWLLIPLFIAILVVIVSKGPYMDALNTWSYKNSQKPIFNGRDFLWEMGFNALSNHLVLGNGNLGAANWHNCVVTCFTAYGIPGLILWIALLKNILSKGREWINDITVQGCIITFIIMYIQQSVELGLISETPNLLPYVVLGMMLGRVKELEVKNRVIKME